MSNLRLLIINDVDVHLSEDLEYLSNELRLLEWHGYPLKSLPSSFQPQRLVQLSLCYSRIEYIWKDIKPSMKYLKTINLSFSHNLIKTPDFEMIPYLERLDLQCCTKLREVHKSVGSLGKLIVLNLNECGNLVVFPSDVCGLKSLKILNLNGCSKLDTLPLNLEEVEPLEELDISGTAIEQIVISSIVQLKNLRTLSLRGCKVGPPKTWSFSLGSWLMLPTRKSGCMGLMLPPLVGLSFLRELDASYCNLLEIPSDIGSLFFLGKLKLGGNNFVSLPDSISQLSRLYYLSLMNCQRLQSLPKLPPKIGHVVADDCTSDVVFTGKWNSQQSFNYYNCLKLDANARVNIMANAQLRIQVMATKARGTASLKDYLEDNMEGDSVGFSFCSPGNEIPEWFSHQHRGSSVVIKLPPHWCSTKFLGFALCVVAAFEDCEYFNLFFNCKCYFLTKDGEVHEIVCDLQVMKLEGRLGFQESDHVFLLYAHGLSTVFEWGDGEHNLSIHSSCQEALFEFSAVDKDLQPIPNFKIKKCGVHLLYLEEETTQISGDDSINKAGLVESGGDGIPNTAEDEATEQHNSESEVDTLLLSKREVKLIEV